MPNDLNPHSINDMTVAIEREMTHGAKRHPVADTVFMGGKSPTSSERDALGRFGCEKNYKIVFPCFDAEALDQGPVGFEVVVTDGMSETMVVLGGRLWKRDRASRAVLVFAESKIIIKLNTKGQLVVRPTEMRHHDHGYELARESVVGGALKKPGKLAVVSMIGALMTVLDGKTMQIMMAGA